MRHLRQLLKLGLVLAIAAVPMAARAVGAKSGIAAEAQAARDDVKATLGFVPGFIKALPDNALPGAWEEMKGLQMNPNTALPSKMKELVGLAVAAQVPCKYCIYAHTEFAKLAGATDAEIAEAVVMGSLTRHWSTFMNGVQLDESKFRGELARMMESGKKTAGGKMPPGAAAMPINSYDSAMADIKQTFGFVPEFLAKFPASGLPGAWKEMKYVQMAPDTALANKNKELIGLGVAAQIPCKYCIIVHTELAKAGGATDAEIGEAVAMAGLVRHWSTWLNGMQISEQAFKKDIDQLVRGAKKAQKAPAPR